MAAGDILEWVASLPRKRAAWLALALSAAALEACALFFQYGLELQPCVMCIYIRIAVLGLLGAGILGAIAPATAVGQVIGFAAWGAAAGKGLPLSRELIAIQSADPTSFTAVCSFLPRFPAWLPLHEWMPAFFMPTGSCTDDVWSWLGLTMAQWMQGIFAAYLLVLALVLLAMVAARLRRRQPV